MNALTDRCLDGWINRQMYDINVLMKHAIAIPYLTLVSDFTLRKYQYDNYGFDKNMNLYTFCALCISEIKSAKPGSSKV